ncbi:MAG: hypothetical protein B7X04_01815 [Parcubacteria group bacterium 21-54-25]|nr:MAG: hypothetical protein B7X04_01815 [Parcubacteria group bacterium 21-54-25]
MQPRTGIDKSTLEKALRAAEKAHGVYEKRLGRRDSRWPRWYAAFMVKWLQKKHPTRPRATQRNLHKK